MKPRRMKSEELSKLKPGDEVVSLYDMDKPIKRILAQIMPASNCGSGFAIRLAASPPCSKCGIVAHKESTNWIDGAHLASALSETEGDES